MWIVRYADGREILLPNEPTPLDGLPVEGEDEPENPITNSAEVDREPAEAGCEDWDWPEGKWIVNVDRAEAWENAKHAAERGVGAIDQAHAVKSIEARLILAGVALDGLVKAEATATGQDLHELAETIVDQSDVDNAAEVARIMARRAIREAAEG